MSTGVYIPEQDMEQHKECCAYPIPLHESTSHLDALALDVSEGLVVVRQRLRRGIAYATHTQ